MASERLSASAEQGGVTALFIGSDEAAMALFINAGRVTGVDFLPVQSAAEALAAFPDIRPSLIVIDYANIDLPPNLVAQQFRLASDTIGLIALSTDPKVCVATRTPLARPDEMLLKSFDIERIGLVLRAMVERLRLRKTDLAIVTDPERLDFFKTFSSVFRRGAKTSALEEAVLGLTDSDAPVLLRGEGGVGKKTIGRALHYLSRRSGARYTTVRCSALPPDLLEVELFGVERTDDTHRQGQIELTHGGTVILDEFTELSLTLQAKITEIVRDRRLRRVGGRTPVDVDVRIIATTSKDVESVVGTGRIRFDLNEALEHVVFVPPLRERADDIPGLAEFFRLDFMKHYRQDAELLSTGIMDLLKNYHWPGNVLELQNLIKRCVVLGNEASVADELHARSQSSTMVRKPPRRLPANAVSLHDIGRKAAEEAQIAVILQVLKDVHWNRAEAARALNVSYKTLLNKLNRAGVVSPAKRALRPES